MWWSRCPHLILSNLDCQVKTSNHFFLHIFTPLNRLVHHTWFNCGRVLQQKRIHTSLPSWCHRAIWVTGRRRRALVSNTSGGRASRFRRLNPSCSGQRLNQKGQRGHLLGRSLLVRGPVWGRSKSAINVASMWLSQILAIKASKFMKSDKNRTLLINSAWQQPCSHGRLWVDYQSPL